MITSEDFKHIANLAKLEFNRDEKIEMKIYMENTLKYIKQLENVDIDNIIIGNNKAAKLEDVREDIVEKSLEIEEVLKNAITKKDNFFTVPNYKSVVKQNDII